MPDNFIVAVCSQCNRAFNVSNPYVELTATSARCPHCGQVTEVAAEVLDRARKFRSGQEGSSRTPS